MVAVVVLADQHLSIMLHFLKEQEVINRDRGLLLVIAFTRNGSSLNADISIFYRGGGPSDYRPVIHYRDLDAPREPEEFI